MYSDLGCREYNDTATSYRQICELVFRSTRTHTQYQHRQYRLRRAVMDWKHLLASITGTVDQELLLRNEYLVKENRILRNQLKDRVRLTDGERIALAEIG